MHDAAPARAPGLTPLRVLTVDDEPLALRRLRSLLSDISDVVQVGEADGREAGIAAVAKLRPDVLLLDIKMRDGTGFELLDALEPTHLPAIVFVSAFEHYAVRAFETNAADYVLKPVQADRLEAALLRARRRMDATSGEERLAELKAVVGQLRERLREIEGKALEDELWIRKSSGGYKRVPLGSVDWVSSEEDYVRLHTPEGSYLLRGSIRGFESRIDPTQFTRVHRRALVRNSSIREVARSGYNGLEVVLASGERLKAGRIYAKRVRSLLARPSAAPGQD